jgi:hypothetical protein
MDKTKHHTHLAIDIRATERAAVRAEVFQYWINEQPGSSSVRNTYRYDVEKLTDSSFVYLTRPTRLNKGADFVILCQNFKKFKNGNDKPPSHGDLFDELEPLVALSTPHKKEIMTALRRIWDCENSKQILNDLKLFKNNVKAERVLLLAKWFFIEQDVTYWTDSGRHMLREGFESHFGNFP